MWPYYFEWGKGSGGGMKGPFSFIHTWVADFFIGGLDFFFKKCQYYLDPSDFSFKGTNKTLTLYISFFKRYQQKNKVRIFAILRPGMGRLQIRH